MMNLVNAILCLRKFLWKFRYSFSCATRVVPTLRATLHRIVDGFVKQRGHYYHHPVSIRWVLDFGLGRRWPDAPPSLSDRSQSLFPSCVNCSLILLQPNFAYILSNLLLHICFGLPRFRCPFISSTLPSTLLTTFFCSDRAATVHFFKKLCLYFNSCAFQRLSFCRCNLFFGHCFCSLFLFGVFLVVK